MKVIIIEGPDNTGKNTLINHVLDNNEIVKIIHCSKPKQLDNVLYHQFISFKKLAEEAIKDYSSNSDEVLIYNRYHIGEYVYGQLYRNENPEQILEVIHLIEDTILNAIPQDNISYIQLLSRSAKLLQNNDDNKSLSNARLDLIEKENQLFKEAFEKSKFKNKHIIYIDKENTDTFKTREQIIDEFDIFTKND